VKRRTILAKNRNAFRTGIAPYTRQDKRPYLYSPSYHAWFRQVTNRAAADGVERNK